MDKILQNNNIMLENQIIIARRTTPSRFFLYESKKKMKWIFSNMVIIYVVKGMIRIKTKLGESLVGEKDVFLLNPNVFFELLNIEDSILLFLQVDRQYFKDPLDYQFKNNLGPGEKQDLIYNFGLLYRESLLVEPSLAASYKYLDRILHILKDSRFQIPRETFDYSRENDTRDIVVEILEKSSLDNKYDFNLGDLAREYNISAPHLSRTFKQVIGANITDVFKKKRLNYAIDLLINSQLNITEISIESGFSNIKSLNQELNKEFNLSASSFRKLYKTILKTSSLALAQSFYLENFLNEINQVEARPRLSRPHLVKVNLKQASLKDNIGWNNALDLESLIEEDIEEIVGLFKSKFKFEIVRIKLEFRQGVFGYLGKDGKFKPCDLQDIERIVDIFINYRIVPIFSLVLNQEGLSPKELDFFYKVVRIFSRKRLYLKNKDFFIELSHRQEDFFQLDQDLLLKRLSYLRQQFNPNFFQNLKLGLDLGSFKIYNLKEDLRNIDKLKGLRNHLDFISFESVCLNFNFITLNDYGEKLRLILGKLRSVIFQGQPDKLIFFDLVYSLDKKNASILGESPYFYIFYIGLISKIISKNSHLLATKIKHTYLESSPSSVNYLNISHELGIYNFNYFIKDSINRLGNEVIYNENGVLFTRLGNDYLGVVFGNIYQYIPGEEPGEKLDMSSPNRLIDLSLENIKGNYKKTISKISEETYYFYRDWLDNYNPQPDYIEKKYIQAKSLPELQVKYLNCSGSLDLSFNLNEYDLYFISLESMENIRL